MTPTKLLVGQILIVFAIVGAGLWTATQWCAAMFGYQSELGAPWFSLGNLPVYRPWDLFLWWYSYEAYAPHVFDKAGALAGASGFLGCAAAIGGSLWRARQASFVTTYGSARWAEQPELRRAGLYGDTGVFLGWLHGQYLRHNGPEHVMAFAPTRSGKGVGLVVPTLLSWSGSAIIHDIKGENWELTAGWRSLFSHCLLFNPTDPCSAKYNPLLEVRRGAEEIRDVQNIADILVDPIITTDRRTYHLELESRPMGAMAAIAWSYPHDELLALRRAQEASAAAMPVASSIVVEKLNFNYVISGDRPEWRPVRAFDDGRQTFIEFPPSIAVGEAPPIFIVGDSDQIQLVNFRIAGRYYVVDRLFTAAELRLGQKKQQIVRISRLPPERRRKGRNG